MSHSAQSKDPFFSLPVEITEDVLIASEPQGVARLSQCSKHLYNIVNRTEDNHIWRSLFLNIFDHPQNALYSSRSNTSPGIRWKAELKRRIQAQNIIRSTTEQPNDTWGPGMRSRYKWWASEVIDAYDICAEIIREATPAVSTHYTSVASTSSSVVEKSTESNNIEWMDLLLRTNPNFLWPPAAPLRQSSLGDLVEPVPPKVPEPDNSLGQYFTNSPSRARLRAHFGVSSFETACTPFDSTRLVARMYVYDLRNYRPETLYGPWSVDEAKPGSVTANWIHINHILTVIVGNLDEYRSHIEIKEIDPPTGLEHTRSHSAPGWEKRAERDWAGVEGTWKRIICFMDYTDLDGMSRNAC